MTNYVNNTMASPATFKSSMPLFIPRVFSEHASEQYITTAFHVLGLGAVSRVDLHQKTDSSGKTYFEAFIHFSQWFWTQQTVNLQQEILDPSTVAKLVHGERPHPSGCGTQQTFWILNECHNPETDAERKMQERLAALEDLVADQQQDMLASLGQRDAMITQLFGILETQADQLARLEQRCGVDGYGLLPEEDTLVDGVPVEEFDLHHDSTFPQSVEELPLSGVEMGAGRSCFEADFYQEAGDSLTPEWLALTPEQKRSRLDAEMDQLKARVPSESASVSHSPEYSVSSASCVSESSDSTEYCPGCMGDGGIYSHWLPNGDQHPACIESHVWGDIEVFCGNCDCGPQYLHDDGERATTRCYNCGVFMHDAILANQPTWRAGGTAAAEIAARGQD